ncbi:L,D-transpeptidase family protein [uncultured Merdimonas sp.]|uniref:L,D-transpeptidase family protein n=1 Tax=uncultured Merdimonas sp. TaxID=2023269 RepID=UPI0032094124
MKKRYAKALTAAVLALCMIAQPCAAYAADAAGQTATAEAQTGAAPADVPEGPETAAPVQDAEESAPVQDAEESAPVQNAEESAPVQDAGENVPAQGAEESAPAADVTQAAPETEAVQTELAIELSESLSSYAEKQTDISGYADILTLELKTAGEYRISLNDLETLTRLFPALTKLDARESVFDSEETMEAFAEQLAGTGAVEFLYTEGAFPADDAEGADAKDADTEDAEDLELQDEGFTLKLNGICVLDKGNKYEVGVSYESDDPDVEFRWLQYDLAAGVWTQVSKWYKGNWATWTPEKAGDYWIYVEARTTDGKTASSVYGCHYKGIQVSLNGICLLDKKDHFEVGVAYKSNDPGLQFRWLQYDVAAGAWTQISSKWESGNWVTWTPKKAGDYWLHVEAKDSDGNVKTQTLGYHYAGYQLSLNGICVITQPAQVDMGVAYTTNDPNIEFQWKLYDLSLGKWFQISEWNASNWASWKPEKSGDYWLYVEARTGDGQIKTQVYGYRVSAAKITSFTVSPKSPGWTDSTITLKGTYQDLIGEVGSCRYLAYNGSYWTELSQEGSSAKWTPGKVGSYLLCFEIYNKDGKLIEQSFTSYSIEEPYMNISGIYVRKDGTMKYALAASAKTNDNAAQYRFLYYEPATGKWFTISDWSNSNSTTWNAPKEGYYWLHVEAKIHGGIVKTYTMGYTVNRYPADLESMMYLANAYSSSTPYLILVNCTTHKVGIFQGFKGNWTPVYYWDCTNGAPATPTVKGTFRVGTRGYYFDSGSSRCYWYTQFYGNYLFHSVLYSKYTGALADGRLGMALSHGCVRLNINNAKWIYDNIPTGTTVVVY